MKVEAPTQTQITARLEALERYAIFGSAPEAAFDRIVQMVGELFGAASVHINFLDDCVQWSKACHGSDASGVGLENSFCARAILQDDIFVVLDAANDPRFCTNPLVTGEPKIRFYAGAVLKSSNGVNFGTLCLVDPEPRGSFRDHERHLLRSFAAIVMDELELRHSLRALAETRAELQRAHEALARHTQRLEETSSALTQVNKRLQYDATHDLLTGLPNRAHFLAQLRRTLESPARPFALLFLDFDRFKLINDSLGHVVGDEVLKALTRRLRHKLKKDDILARFGGDEFSVLLYDATPSEALATAERLRKHACAPVRLDGRTLRLGVSIGVVSSAENYSEAEEMLQDADIAMYAAKADGKKGDKGAVLHFQPSMREGVVARLSLEDELRKALKQNQLSVYYQPIFNASGSPVGVEALVRWQHPERGFIAPTDFIPVAEDSGLIIPLECFVLKKAVEQVANWNRSGPELSLSVNLSSWHFGHSELVAFVAQALNESKMRPGLLTLELTESALLENSSALYDTLKKLKTLGVKLALDDFGTGYSSLSYLQRVPLDLLKIDRSFVRQMGQTPKNTELVRTIMAMARTLELDVVAEGVETEAQHQALLALGCLFVQGFLFAKPLPADATEDLLRPGRFSEAPRGETENSLQIR